MDDIEKITKEKMEKALSAVQAAFSKIRTGRAHTGLVEHIPVPYYGSFVPLCQVASLTLADSRTISVQPWEKGLLPVIEKAIRNADLGLNPVSSGEAVCVPMPFLSEERRRDLVKIVRSESELGRVSIRNIRRDANSSLKSALKQKTISEDEEHHLQDKIQKLTDRFIADIDKLMQAKENEVMSI